MRVTFLMPGPEPARRRFGRPVKYSVFPPLGLATLAAYLRDEDEATLQDECVERLDLEDAPDLVALEVFTTSANRAYEIADHYRARGIPVAMGGIHVTALPEEAAQHADFVFQGPGEDTWPRFLADFRAGHPQPRYRSVVRTLVGQPPPRRDLVKRNRYVAANSLVVSRGCPHACDFCTNSTFFQGGASFYTQTVDDALAEMARLPGRHLYFMDDHLFGNRVFARELFAAMRGMGRVWQAAGTVQVGLDVELLTAAVEAGLRTLLVGFETLSVRNLEAQHKRQNLHRDYGESIRRLHDAGVMVNGTFVFGLDDDDASVFDRTVEWAISQGMETATFHILTPYPGTPLRRRLEAEGRITSNDWSRYDTAHAVIRPARMTAAQLEAGYHRACRDFYSWRGIWQNALHKETWPARLVHAGYAGAWGRLQLGWEVAAMAGMAGYAAPVLAATLSASGRVLRRPTTRRAEAETAR